jgi:hypothetical protein
MKKIYKYELFNSKNPTDEKEISLPINHKKLKIGIKNNTVYLWALIDTKNVTKKHICKVIGTGWNLNECLNADEITVDQEIETCYVGSVELDRFVWHILIY